MTPAQLKTFTAVIRNGSVKEAAVELGVSEAAVSSHTAALRKELDDPLYQRAGTGLSFTPGGLRLATRAVELLGLQDQTRLEVSAAGRGQRSLRLASTSLFAEYAAPGLLELFKTRADDLDVELSEYPGSRFTELLRSRQAEVTIGPTSSDRDDGLRHLEFLKYQLILVVDKGHALADRRSTADSLENVPWLLGPSAVDENSVASRMVQRFNVPEQNQRIFQSHSAALAAVQAGAGIGIVPEFSVQRGLAQGRLTRVDAPGAAAEGRWRATSLPSTQATDVTAELMRFITTPRAIQAMLTGSGADIARFRPSVHITLWS